MREVKIYFVTGNKHKFREISKILEEEAPWISLELIKDIPKVEIQADSLEEIALFAVENICRTFQESFIVEEAGLFIDALNDFPGPYSSYVFKTIGCEGILKLMRNIDNRGAEFRSVIALYHQGIIKVFRGIVRGAISYEKKGQRGFGFDPIFIPEGNTKTFAEMTLEEKNAVSHRGKSTRMLIDFLKSIY